MAVYNIDGNVLVDEQVEFSENMTFEQKFDEETATNYFLIRVFKTKRDGTSQYPFVYAPNGDGAATNSTLEMSRTDKWLLAINAGLFNASPGDLKPNGIIIQNATVVKSTTTSRHLLTVDGSGNLSYSESNADAATLVQNGIVSAVTGFYPIIIDYEDAENTLGSLDYANTAAQRQIFGQFGNGDYAVVTCEGRGFDNSTGWTIPQAIQICQKIGLKYAYNLDGGGSTETVLGQKQVNAIYENTEGRIVPTYIVFNGRDQFAVPIQN